MKTRLDLRNVFLDILERLGILYRNDGLLDFEGGAILDSDGTPVAGRVFEDGHLYFQPPPIVQMKYPAIVYEMSGMASRSADNRPYITRKQYTVTAIDKDPDSGLPDELAAIPTARMSRFFTSDNLNHWVFSLYQ